MLHLETKDLVVRADIMIFFLIIDKILKVIMLSLLSPKGKPCIPFAERVVRDIGVQPFFLARPKIYKAVIVAVSSKCLALKVIMRIPDILQILFCPI